MCPADVTDTLARHSLHACAASLWLRLGHAVVVCNEMHGIKSTSSMLACGLVS